MLGARGVGTVYAGLVLLLAIVSAIIYYEYVSNTAMRALHEKQMLYEKARYIAEHVNLTDSTVSLPEPADLIVIDPSGVPHAAKNVTQLRLPWPASKSTIYVVKTGKARVGVADPVASSTALASVAIAPVRQNQTHGGISGCDWYLDPVLYNITGDPWMYRGYVPVGNLSSRLSAFFGKQFHRGNSPVWKEWLASLGLPDPGFSHERIWQAVYCEDYGVLVAVKDDWYNVFRLYKINVSGAFLLSTGSSYSSSVEYWEYSKPRWDLHVYTLFLNTPSCFAYINYTIDNDIWFSYFYVTVEFVLRAGPGSILYVDSAYATARGLDVNVTAPAIAGSVGALYSEKYNDIYSHPTTYDLVVTGVIYSRC